MQSALMISPFEQVASARQVMTFTESLMKRTLPSANRMLTPPGCRRGFDGRALRLKTEYVVVVANLRYHRLEVVGDGSRICMTMELSQWPKLMHRGPLPQIRVARSEGIQLNLRSRPSILAAGHLSLDRCHMKTAYHALDCSPWFHATRAAGGECDHTIPIRL
jgi:hypothetical protein